MIVVSSKGWYSTLDFEGEVDFQAVIRLFIRGHDGHQFIYLVFIIIEKSFTETSQKTHGNGKLSEIKNT
jgi:hypothetical protein